MTENELLWFIFVDTLTSNLAFISSSELAIWAAPKLSKVSHHKILTFAFGGVFFATLINYLIGILCANIFEFTVRNNKQATKNAGVMKSIFDNFGIYLLVAGFIPVYSKFIALFSGFSRYKISFAITIIPIVKTLFYAYYNY